MAIHFLCPNGHKLTAPEDQAGKGGKCPKCEATFRVPTPAADTAAASPRGAAPRWSAPAASGPADQGKLATIVFLCPNGHRLSSPADRVGRPGKCPHCGVKFLVPTADGSLPEPPHDAPSPEPSTTADAAREAAAPVEPKAGAAGGENPSQELAINLEIVETQTAEDELPMVDMEEVPEALVSMPSPHSVAAGNGVVAAPTESHPLADLISSLWACKAPGATVELRLADGEILAPDGYAKELSRRNHGVFAVRQPDGTHTLMAIAWDAVARVSVRGVTSLREGMFQS